MKTSTPPTTKVPKGYKLTRAGLIPEDWEVKPLRDVAQIRSGIAKNSSASVADPILVHYLRVANVQDGYLDLSEMSSIAISRSDLNRFSVLPGDVLMNEGGDLDKLARGAVWNGEFTPCVHQNHVFVVRCGPTVDPVYLTNWSAGTIARRYFLVAGKQTTNLASINKTALGGLPVSVPNSTEQHAIAEALSDVDGLIEALEKLIAKKQAIKQAAMQQLLTGKTRLPGFSKEWCKMNLGNLCEMSSGGTPDSSNSAHYDGDIPWVSISDMTSGGKFIFSTERNLTSEGLVNSAAKVFPRGTILYAMYASIGECSITGAPVSTSQAILGIQPKPTLDGEFLYYLLTSLKPAVISLGQQGTQANLNKGMVEGFAIDLPSLPEQTAIAGALSNMDVEIELLEHRRDKTRDIKQGMLQQLLTGRIRLIKPQAAVVQANAKSKESKPHSWAFNEAVVISTLAKHFGKEAFPLGRKRYTKLSYLLHRHVEKQAEGYLKKAAGPYNPKTKYGGPERVALESGYVREHKHGAYSGFVAADNIALAEGYFEKWYGKTAIQWLERFRYKKNDDLELLATVDMAAEELRAAGKDVDVPSVKAVISGHPEWKAKLDREIFSEANIDRAIRDIGELFAGQG